MSTKKVDRYATFNHVADWAIKEHGLGVADFGVWAYFWRHGDDKRGFVTLGYGKIMKDLNIGSVNTLRKHINNLIRAGLIGIEKKGRKNQEPTKYWYKKKIKKP